MKDVDTYSTGDIVTGVDPARSDCPMSRDTVLVYHLIFVCRAQGGRMQHQRKLTASNIPIQKSIACDVRH